MDEATSGETEERRQRRSKADRLADLKQREERLQQEIRRLALSVSADQRKARTRRLIQTGAVADAYGITTPEMLEHVLAGLVRTPAYRERLVALGATPTPRWPGEHAEGTPTPRQAAHPAPSPSPIASAPLRKEAPADAGV